MKLYCFTAGFLFSFKDKKLNKLAIALYTAYCIL